MFRTNFSNKELPRYKKAIIEFKSKTGSDRFYIENQALDCNGKIVIDSSSLHDKEHSDASLFWEIYNNTNIVTQEEMYLNMQYYMEYCQSNGYVTPMEWIDKYKHF